SDRSSGETGSHVSAKVSRQKMARYNDWGLGPASLPAQVFPAVGAFPLILAALGTLSVDAVLHQGAESLNFKPKLSVLLSKFLDHFHKDENYGRGVKNYRRFPNKNAHLGPLFHCLPNGTGSNSREYYSCPARRGNLG